MSPLRATVALGLVLLGAPVGAQSPPPAVGGRPVRVVLAGGRLQSVVEMPRHFKLLRVSIPSGQAAGYAGADSMVYVMSGSVDLAVDGDRRNLREGGATFVPGGRPATFAAAGGAPAVLLHFLLVPAADLDQAMHNGPAAVVELYRTRAPIPALRPGLHEFTMTRVSVERGSPRPPMHHRSGAALYYVLSGTWTLHEDGARAERRAPGGMQYEPSDFVHSWQNTGDTTGALLQANISPEGSPEIIFLPQR